MTISSPQLTDGLSAPTRASFGGVTLSVVVPAYNASAFIERSTRELVDALERMGERMGVTWEVIVVDDGSDDDTSDSVVAHPQVRVIRLASNAGKGAAVRAGMLAASGAVRIFTDADLPYGTALFPYVLEYIQRRGFHAVIGDRVLPGSEYGHATLLRRIVSAVASFLFRTLVTGGMYDTQCGFKALRGDVADALFPLLTIDRFAFDVEVIYLLLKYNLDIKRIPVRLQHESRSTVHVVRDTARAIRDILKLRWNWMNRRYASPALSDIYIADMPAFGGRVADVASGSATIRATASSRYG
ncbi:MAG TPA: glycosyltransferase [Gemmatimonadaceae bacterium]|jgi:glycosyltransferase involved in cell wall biosynthesis|nr:glycosyltransferase [Gemmatimonadaceae bacterium]